MWYAGPDRSLVNYVDRRDLEQGDSRKVLVWRSGFIADDRESFELGAGKSSVAV